MAECELCGDSLKNEHGLKIHYAQSHGKSIASVSLTCSWCGEEFQRIQSEVVDADDYYCSQDCRKEYWNNSNYCGDDNVEICPWDGCQYKSQTELGIKQHHAQTHGVSLTLTEFECRNCAKKFERKQYGAKEWDMAFCSNECRNETIGNLYSKRFRGENHPQWKGGHKEYYGETWHQQRRKAIDRDEEQCQDCGLTRDDHYDEYGRDLEVHHITPIRTFNDTEEANQLSNLITLCKSCHLQRENS